MKALKKTGKILLDIIEIYFPMLVFACLFLTFVYQIFCRYVLRSPVSWSYEMGLLTFVWTTMFGACYAWRDNEHIVFSLIYDNRSEKGKCIFDLLGAIIVFVLMVLAIQPTWKYIMTQRRASSVMKISYKVMYFPFLIMIIDTCFRQVYNAYKAIKRMTALKKEGAK